MKGSAPVVEVVAEGMVGVSELVLSRIELLMIGPSGGVG